MSMPQSPNREVHEQQEEVVPDQHGDAHDKHDGQAENVKDHEGDDAGGENDEKDHQHDGRQESAPSAKRAKTIDVVAKSIEVIDLVTDDES